jgi:hypothetical protein
VNAQGPMTLFRPMLWVAAAGFTAGFAGYLAYLGPAVLG